MAVYAIGDVQGCYESLRRLLDALDFEPARDRLWFTGDLVNRGPDSLGVLRFVRGLGDAALATLGNHDLHLLAVAAGLRRARRRDTLQPVLDAPDAHEMLAWLRHRPLAHYDPELDWLLVHAGLPPQWDRDAALARAREVEHALRGDGHTAFLEGMYGNKPARWRDTLAGVDRLRFITNCLTRIRYCSAKGALDFDSKDPPGRHSKSLMPWFRVPGRAARKQRIVFGHWSTLGGLAEPRLIGVDTGCVWGGALSAARLDAPGKLVSVPCTASLAPDEAD